ncbi:MAG: hypothetical protein ABIJ96_03380 [Elusimicrobiota bacterium]
MKPVSGHLLALTLVVFALALGDDNPRVLLFAFILSTFVRLYLVDAMLRISNGKMLPALRARIQRYARRPTAAEIKWAEGSMRQEDIPSRLGDYGVLLGGLAFFTFILVHVDNGSMDFSWNVFVRELALALWITFVYAAENVHLREIAIDFSQPLKMNLLYNSVGVTLLAVVILTTGIGAAAVTGPESAWALMLPLLLLKHGIDLRAALRSSA